MTAATPDLDGLARALAADDARPLLAALGALGMRPPEIRWNPSAAELPDARLRGLLAYWRALRSEGSPARLDTIDPTRLGEAIGYVMLLETLPDGDSVYRLYGSRIAERAGFDMTGKRTSDIASHPASGMFFGTVYRAVALRRVPVYTRHTAAPQTDVVHWSRLALPLQRDDGRIDFLVGNVPGELRPVA